VQILGFLEKPKITVVKFLFSVFFFTGVTNLIQMVFKYELRYVAFTWPNLFACGTWFCVQHL